MGFSTSFDSDFHKQKPRNSVKRSSTTHFQNIHEHKITSNKVTRSTTRVGDVKSRAQPSAQKNHFDSSQNRHNTTQDAWEEDKVFTTQNTQKSKKFAEKIIEENEDENIYEDLNFNDVDNSMDLEEICELEITHKKTTKTTTRKQSSRIYSKNSQNANHTSDYIENVSVSTKKSYTSKKSTISRRKSGQSQAMDESSGDDRPLKMNRNLSDASSSRFTRSSTLRRRKLSEHSNNTTENELSEHPDEEQEKNYYHQEALKTDLDHHYKNRDNPGNHIATKNSMYQSCKIKKPSFEPTFQCFIKNLDTEEMMIMDIVTDQIVPKMEDGRSCRSLDNKRSVFFKFFSW